MKQARTAGLYSVGVLASQRVGLISLGVLLSLFLLEVLARLIPLWPDPLFQADERFGWELIPNARGWFVNPNLPFEVRNYVTINSRGLNDREYSYHIAADTFRVLLLGDSFAAGLELHRDQSFPKIAERCLQGTFGVPIEIVNTGVNAYATDNELLFYLNEGYRYEADLVLLAFHPNDVQGNHPEMATLYFEKPYYALTEGHLELKNFPVAHKPQSPKPDTWFEFAKDWLHRHSKFYNFAGVMIKSSHLTHLRSVLVRLGLMDSPDASQSKGWFEESVFSEEYVPKWDEAWAITRALIHELRQEARSRGAEFAVVIVTDDRQLSEIDGVEVDLAKPNRLLTEFLDQEAIPYLDLYPVLLTFQTKTGIPVHLTNDVHWTAEGHRQAGEQVCAWLHETVPFSP